MSEKVLSLSEEDLNTLSDMLTLYRLLMDMMNDQVVEELSKQISALVKLMNGLISSDLPSIVERAMQDPELDKALLDPPKVGLSGLLGALRDEDFQRGLGIAVELLKALGRASKEIRGL